MSDAADPGLTHPGPAEAPGAPAIRLAVTYYTDPLCCWSWAFEPQLRRLRYAHAGRLAWRVRMGGLIGSWQAFEDPLNAVYRPSQMGPLWLQANHVSGMPIEPAIWMSDPPSSSRPACLAVKAAELQSAWMGDVYLRRVREAVMVEGRNIANAQVLVGLAEECAGAFPGSLDLERFRTAFEGSQARDALLADIKEARFRGIGRFPALVLQRPGGAPRVLVGWRPYGILKAEIDEAAPDLGPERRPADAEAYRTYWTRITEREVEEGMAEAPGPACAVSAPACPQPAHPHDRPSL